MSFLNLITYDDDWIIANWEKYRNWLSLRNEYNRIHHTDIGYTTFKSHCNRKLGLNFLYTKEQKEWLIEHYPSLGRVKVTELFNETFDTNKSIDAIKNQCRRLGLKVNEQRKKDRALENTGTTIYPIGAEVIKQHGEIYVKTEAGYKRKKDLIYGEKPKGSVLVHLDGDPQNCTKDNLMPLSRSHLALMTKNNFWSSNAEITKTGVKCCDLAIALKEKNIDDSI